jgi:hypothetical protein
MMSRAGIECSNEPMKLSILPTAVLAMRPTEILRSCISAIAAHALQPTEFIELLYGTLVTEAYPDWPSRFR